MSGEDTAGAAKVPEGRGKVVVIGLGGSGARTVARLSSIPEAHWLDSVAIDTDKAALSGISVGSSLLADSEWRSGAGCGGDVIKGERSIARERSRLAQIIEGASLLVVAGGLGGGTGTGGARVVASVAKNASVPAIFLLSTPFSFESYARRKAAEDCISELLPMVDILLCLPNDLLFSTLPPDTPAEDAFSKACEEMARTVLGVSEALMGRNLLPSDFASFMAALHGRKAVCGVGVGVASGDEGLNRCHLAIERMLESPLLGGVSKLESADAVILSLTGGPDLQIAEMKRAIEAASSLTSKNAALIVGANTDSSCAGKVQMTAVTVKYEHIPDPVPAARADSSWSSTRLAKQSAVTQTMLEQGVLELQSYSKGIFSSVSPTKYKDEDLDIPSFQRRGVIIDKGDVGR